MEKTRLLLAIMLSLFSLNEAIGQISQWEVYNAIPDFKSITFIFNNDDAWEGYSIWSESQGLRKDGSGNNLGLAILDDYTVELGYLSTMYLCRDEYRRSTITVYIHGNGIIRWQNDRMVLDLDVRVSTAGGSARCSKYEETRHGDVYSTEEFSFSSFESSNKYTYVLELTNEGFKLSGNDIKSTITGTNHFEADNGVSRDIPIYYQTCLKLTGRAFDCNVSEKTQSELNAESSDAYGKWQWNDDRSVIYLESTTKDAYLVLWNNDGSLGWGFQMDKAASGYKTETAENGAELAYLMLTFDGGAEQSFTFEKSIAVSGSTNFQYVQYDRFMGTMKRDASILGQIKDKRILILNYKQNGSDKTAMFKLEGLEAIYNAITR